MNWCSGTGEFSGGGIGCDNEASICSSCHSILLNKAISEIKEKYEKEIAKLKEENTYLNNRISVILESVKEG